MTGNTDEGGDVLKYREGLYSTYVSKNTSHLYGEAGTDLFVRQFPVWKKYYTRFLPLDKSARIIEIGCGNGGFLYCLKKFGYENSYGIDISPEQIRIAKKLGMLNVECADVIDFLQDKKGIYDVIVIRDVIEHFTKNEILEMLRLMFSSLKQGGIVIIQTPNGESPFGSRFRYWDFTHEMSFTRMSLSHILRLTGFGRINFYPTGPVPHGVKSTLRFLLWKIIEMTIRFYMVVETGSGEGVYTQNIIAVAEK
jgi:2-polyprenyl-3-methyl-5-hydroxy-6-metoxy-1,4-benzoquinol methylase